MGKSCNHPEPIFLTENWKWSLVLSLQGCCNRERGCYHEKRAEKEPLIRVGDYYFIIGQLFWKCSFLLLEVTCIKVYASLPPTHCQTHCSLRASLIPLRQIGNGYQWLSTCCILWYLVWEATAFFLKCCSLWLFGVPLSLTLFFGQPLLTES